MPVGQLHLLYGLAGSGKSTLARSLCADGRGVRFTLDEWMLRLYPHLGIDDTEYGVLAEQVRELIWSVAEQVLQAGSDAVLDWNAWSGERRSWAVQRAEGVGAPVVLHKLTADVASASEQARLRADRGQRYAHSITVEGNEHLAKLMQEPCSSEGFVIELH